jgi:inorganic pyrophosphatase
LDALVLLEYPLFPGVGVKVRPVAMLVMEDDGGVDEKVLCVQDKDPRWQHIQDLKDVPQQTLDEIEHFFTRYKDLEPGKWVKIQGWQDKAATQKVIDNAYANFKH